MTSAPVAVQPVPRGALARRVGRRVTDWVPAAVLLLAALLIWEAAIAVLDVKRFLLPQPSDLAGAFWDARSALLQPGWITFQ